MTQHVQPPHIGHRKRIKQRFYTVGPDAFLDHELLELLLTYAIARKDTKPIAWALLKRFGSLNSVLDADETSLLDVEGVGPYTARLIKLTRGLLKRYMLTQVKKNIQIRSPQQVLNYCKASLADKKEEFLEVIFLSVRRTVINTRIRATGEIDQVVASPRKVVEWALKEKASSIILVHNHPSGDASPSTEDVQMTLTIMQAAQIFGISVLDHIIIAKGTSCSLRASGYF